MRKADDKIVGFQLTHNIKGRETTTRFRKEEVDLFKRWVKMCIESNLEFSAAFIKEGDVIEPIQKLVLRQRRDH